MFKLVPPPKTNFLMVQAKESPLNDGLATLTDLPYIYVMLAYVAASKTEKNRVKL